MNLKTKVKSLRDQTLRRTIDDIERMLNSTKGTGITPALIDTCLRKNRSLVVHSESWKDKLMASEPKLRAVLAAEVRGGDMVLIDNGINHLLLVEARALQRLAEDLLNYIEVKKLEDKP